MNDHPTSACRPAHRDRLIVSLASAVTLLLAVVSATVAQDDGRPGSSPGFGATADLAGSGPVLVWEELRLDEILPAALVSDPRSPGGAHLAWLDDHFALVDDDSDAVSTSPDGSTWSVLGPDSEDADYYRQLALGPIASWDDDLAGWDLDYNQSKDVRLVTRGEGAHESTFEGAVGAVGIGPLGVVAKTHSALDFDAYVTTLLGPDWVGHMDSFGFEDGVLRITTDDDRSIEVVWADTGYEPEDVADRGFGWFSTDGRAWEEIADFPANVFDIVGVEDGFMARGADGDGTGMWHAGDGLTWRRLGDAADGAVIGWKDGALVTGGPERLTLWSANGARVLPMAAELPADWLADDLFFPMGAGPLGLVAFDTERGILFTPDGVEWSLTDVPPDMAAEDGGRGRATVAVGDDAALVLLWSEDEAPVPSLWRATLAG